MQINPENLNEITDKSEYYRQLKLLAQQKRAEFNVSSTQIGLRLIRKIYTQEGIKIDYQNVKSSRIRASYFCEDGDLSVLVKKSLPPVQRLFDLVHELKHHFVDRKLMIAGKIECGDYNKNERVEKGAGIFAAEFIFPEKEMLQTLTDFGINRETVTEEKVVEFKVKCGVKISYEFIKKRLKWFGIIEKDTFAKTKFQNIEDELFPNPFKRTKKKSI
jgi:Zn-dependent peptidase ImmA (M78 family)